MKRAITLGGGGPAAGLHIGILEALQSHPEITFDVWSLSCIGAWVGIVYNQFEEPDKAGKTHQFFKEHVFRDDESYERFPINSVFGTDWFGNTEALRNFVFDIHNLDGVWLPHRMMRAFGETMSMLSDPKQKWDSGDVNSWILNQAMAPNPFVRYLTSLMYLSGVNGLSKINYPDSSFMKSIKFERLFDKDKPLIFHNAFDLDNEELVFFDNGQMKHELRKGPINASTLCACSALPFIEGTVEMNGVTYCEGALVDTVNFETLLQEYEDPNDLDEIWVCRIVDRKQIRKPNNLHDALANLCQLFAATVGEDDVKLFKYHVKYDALPNGKKWTGTVVQIQVPSHIDFKWNHSNLEAGRELGKKAALKAIEAYESEGMKPAKELTEVRFINETPPQQRRNVGLTPRPAVSAQNGRGVLSDLHPTLTSDQIQREAPQRAAEQQRA
jgi:predicted acylesterase/phospholipase RssA